MPIQAAERTSNTLIGIAGVHYVVAELSLRGVIALPTVRNTAAYDIVAVTPSGSAHANIQVKASAQRTRFFPMPAPAKIRAGKRDYYVLVRRLEKEKRFEGLLLSGREAKSAVQETLKWQRRNIRKGTRTQVFPAIDIGAKDPRWARWRKAWDKWSL